MSDFQINDCGSVVMFTPMHDDARAWVDENVGLEPWQWLGPSFAVEHRYADDLIAGIEDDGWEVA